MFKCRVDVNVIRGGKKESALTFYSTVNVILKRLYINHLISNRRNLKTVYMVISFAHV